MTSEITRRFASVDDLRANSQSVRVDQLANFYFKLPQPMLPSAIDARLFGDGSYFDSTLEQALVSDQRTKYAKIADDRRRYWFRARLDGLVMQFDDSLSLRADQHERFSTLLLKEIRIPSQFNGDESDYTRLFEQIYALDVAKLNAIVDGPQIEQLKYQIEIHKKALKQL